MTRDQALELLQHHSFTHSDVHHPKSERGYLGMLRPFDGKLYEANFHELMQLLKLLADDFRQEKIDRKIISSFWSICQLSKAWGLEENGMLRRNNLITSQQVEQLSDWTDCISATVMNLLEGLDDETSFETYRLYLGDGNDSK